MPLEREQEEALVLMSGGGATEKRATSLWYFSGRQGPPANSVGAVLDLGVGGLALGAQGAVLQPIRASRCTPTERVLTQPGFSAICPVLVDLLMQLLRWISILIRLKANPLPQKISFEPCKFSHPAGFRAIRSASTGREGTRDSRANTFGGCVA